jgi:hypothetical protein
LASKVKYQLLRQIAPRGAVRVQARVAHRRTSDRTRAQKQARSR